MAEVKRWTVTTSDRPLKEVADELSEAGFSVDQILTEIGCITGTADAKVAKSIRTVPGVTDVSEEIAFDVGPPESNDTW